MTGIVVLVSHIIVTVAGEYALRMLDQTTRRKEKRHAQ